MENNHSWWFSIWERNTEAQESKNCWQIFLKVGKSASYKFHSKKCCRFWPQLTNLKSFVKHELLFRDASETASTWPHCKQQRKHFNFSRVFNFTQQQTRRTQKPSIFVIKTFFFLSLKNAVLWMILLTFLRTSSVR